MAIDVSELLLDESDETPSGLEGTPEQPKRKRGRPPGSRTKAAPSRAAGARELAQLLAKVIGGASILLAVVIQADEAAMTPQEANDIARPAARLLAKSSLAARMTALAGKGGDWIDLTMALATYGLRLYPLIVLRMQQVELERQRQRGRPYGNGLTPEDAGLRPNGPAQPATPAPASASASPDAARTQARAAADAAAFGGLGYADPDALANGAHGNLAALVRAYPAN